jgi:Zn ribbon nucleic-acid-binding protein
MTNDNLTTCPKCKAEESCYVTPINEFHNAYACFNCGYATSDLMREGEFDVEAYEQEMPELYKDLKYIDEETRVWYPQAINVEDKGTVFANGSSVEDWQWSGIKSIELTEEEKENSKFKGKTHKSDSASLKGFGSDFFEACDYIGLFEVK